MIETEYLIAYAVFAPIIVVLHQRNNNEDRSSYRWWLQWIRNRPLFSAVFDGVMLAVLVITAVFLYDTLIALGRTGPLGVVGFAVCAFVGAGIAPVLAQWVTTGDTGAVQ